MKKIVVGLAAVLLLATGCDRLNPPPPKTPQELIVGDWATTVPIKKEEGDVTIEITDPRITYFKDNKGNMNGLLKLSGKDVPGGAVSFDLAADFTWLVEGTVLREQIIQAKLEPKQSSQQNQAIAKAIGTEMSKQTSANSDIVEINDKLLRARDRGTGLVVEYTRQGGTAKPE